MVYCRDLTPCNHYKLYPPSSLALCRRDDLSSSVSRLRIRCHYAQRGRPALFRPSFSSRTILSVFFFLPSIRLFLLIQKISRMTLRLLAYLCEEMYARFIASQIARKTVLDSLIFSLSFISVINKFPALFAISFPLRPSIPHLEETDGQLTDAVEREEGSL